jgi:hypothetical protein
MNAPTLAEAYWRTRHHTAPEGWADHYWDAWEQPHRQTLQTLVGWVRRVTEPQDDETLVEIGCNAGPNLRRWAQAWPRVKLVGIEINTAAIHRLIQGAEAEGWIDRLTVVIPSDPQDPLRDVKNHVNQVDVIVSCYSLTYLTEARLTIERAVKLAVKGLVLAEPTLLGPPATTWPVSSAPETHRDYLPLVVRAHPRAETLTVEIDPPVDRLNGMVAARWGV